MNDYWNNLRPLEKRLVVAVGSVLFIVLNFWFVVPHFSDLSKTEARTTKAKKTLAVFLSEINRKGYYTSNINYMQGTGLSVPQEEQAFNFSSAIQNQAAQSGVAITGTGKIRSDTNQFFLELSQNVNVISREQPLVDFLYSLGSGNSLIRVRDLGLRPDPPRQQLMANINLVANYQRKVVARPSTTTPATKGSPASKGTATPAKSSESAKTPAKAPETPKSAATNPASSKKMVPAPNKK